MRRYRVYNHPAALKTTIAASMLYLGGYRGEPLLDPMCGGGTIPIEAAHIARRYPIYLFRDDYAFRRLRLYNRDLEYEIRSSIDREIGRDLYEIYCMDISREHIAGAMRNAESAKVIDTIKFRVGDALRRDSYADFDPRLIVVNPPYGIRSWRIERLKELYTRFLRVLRDLYSDVRLILITSAIEQLTRSVETVETEIIHSRRVKHGGLTARVFVIRI